MRNKASSAYSQPANNSKHSRNRQIAAKKRLRTAKITRVIARAMYLKKRGQEDLMANILCDEFIALGGVYAKFLQGVMLRTQLTLKWHNPLRYSVFENLDTEPIDLPSLLKHELPPKLLGQIAQVQSLPFAAGSFGQVYYAELRTGQAVVIKVLRPQIRDTLNYDLKLLSVFARSFFIKLYPNIEINLDDAVIEFKNSTLKETDYIFEADFANELFNTYKDHTYFIIPRTYTELCTANIIVQDYVDGISCAQLLKLQEKGVEPYSYVKENYGSDLTLQMSTLGYECLHGIFALPRIQGDPHPGNVKILPGNRVGLIDFGIAAPAPADKASFFGLIKEFEKVYSDSVDIEGLFGQFIRFFVSDLYRALKKLSELQSSGQEIPDLTRTLGKFAHEALEKQAGPVNTQTLRHQNKNFLTVINQIVNKQNRFGLVVTLQSSEMLRAAQTYVSLVESLGLQEQVLPVVFKNVIEALKKEMPELETEKEHKTSASDAIEIISSWLERVATKDPALFTSILKNINLKGPGVKQEVTENA